MNKQQRYAVYAINNNLKRLKIWYKDQNQLQNFYKFIDYHKLYIDSINKIKSNDYVDFKNRIHLGEIINNMELGIYSEFEGSFPNLYYYEVKNLEKKFKEFLNTSFANMERVEGTAISTLNDDIHNLKINSLTPQDLYRSIRFYASDLNCEYVILHNGRLYMVSDNEENCVRFFNEY